MTTEPETYYCSIDIEKSQSVQGVGIIAVGLVLTNGAGVVLAEKCFSTAGATWLFDWRTMQFWAQHPAILERIDENSRESPLTAANLHEWLMEINKTYGPFGRQHAGKRKFRWICDNPAYDIGQVNLLLSSAFPNSKPLAEYFDDYVPTSDPTEQYEGLLAAEKRIVDEQLITPHSHYPTEDAKRDIEMYVAIQNVLASRNE